MYFCFDTETTGLPSKRHASYRDLDAYANCRILSIGWYLLDPLFQKIEKQYFVIKPDFDQSCCHSRAEEIHCISFDKALTEGVEFDVMSEALESALSRSKFVVGHNVAFDIHVLKHELWRRQQNTLLDAIRDKKVFCTMKYACMKFGWPKYPKLVDLYHFLFQKDFQHAHHALADVRACKNCFIALTQSHVA